MKDRLSIHIDNGQSDVREAVTILRNGGTASQSGLVGITNATYHPVSGSPVVPETIFNVQSTGDSNIRFSSGPSKVYRSSLELLGNGNARASGLHISYNPSLDDAFVVGPGYGGYGYGDLCVDPDTVDNPVADFSLIRPSGSNGVEFSHLTFSERGYVAIGLTRADNNRRVYPHAPLTISYSCDGHQDSGTISMHEQASSPTTHSDFGKIYVKPYSIGGRTQALYFKDDGGFETNLVLSQDLEPSDSLDGLIYGDNFGNTYGGWFTPAARTGDSNTRYNTYYGYGAGFYLGDAGQAQCNTLIGYLTGSGLQPTSNYNTVVGCSNLKNYTTANGNVIVGHNNLSNDSSTQTGSIDDVILIGRNLYNNDLPNDGDLAIGIGTSPLVKGNLTSNNRFFTISDGYFSVVSENEIEFKIDTEYDNASSRHSINLDVIDYNRGGGNYGQDNLKFNFLNSVGLKNTLFQLDPKGNPLTNTPAYQIPSPIRPFAQLDGDFRLRGAIRFQDGTSLSGLSDFELLPTFGASGINKVFQNSNNSNYFVLNYSSLSLAGSLSNNIRTDNTFIAVQVDGTNSSKIGKISLQGLADYVSSGTSSIAENCNVLISNPENELNVNTAANTRSVMIGCDVAFGCSGQYNSIMIGSYAGANATVSNPTLTTPFNNIFIGPSAGESSNDTSYAICIGSSAGKNSDNSEDCLFIGNNAGLESTLTRSIGIGKNALRGGTSTSEGGVGNIEIVAGLDDSERFFYDSANLALSYRIAINKTIAGRTDRRNISIGDARLSPTAPLEARYSDSVGHSSNPTISGEKVIQSWYCNDALVAYMNCDGHIVNNTPIVSPLFVEGKTSTTLLSPSGINNPTTATLAIYEDGVATGSTVTITNRDANLGPIASNTYIVAIKMGSEYRPIWVSC